MQLYDNSLRLNSCYFYNVILYCVMHWPTHMSVTGKQVTRRVNLRMCYAKANPIVCVTLVGSLCITG